MPRLLKFTDSQGYFRWHIKAANGRVLADSGEGYYNEADCDHAIALVRAYFRAN